MRFFCFFFKGLASPGSPTDVGKADGQCLRDGEIVVLAAAAAGTLCVGDANP